MKTKNNNNNKIFQKMIRKNLYIQIQTKVNKSKQNKIKKSTKI